MLLTILSNLMFFPNLEFSSILNLFFYFCELVLEILFVLFIIMIIHLMPLPSPDKIIRGVGAGIGALAGITTIGMGLG
jgi:hypothetical protein